MIRCDADQLFVHATSPTRASLSFLPSTDWLGRDYSCDVTVKARDGTVVYDKTTQKADIGTLSHAQVYNLLPQTTYTAESTCTTADASQACVAGASFTTPGQGQTVLTNIHGC